jgi:RNA polymerase sigma-70 factor (ECF subfamily)
MTDRVDPLNCLLERTLAGDLDAFGEVVRRFQDMAFGCAYAVLGNFADAEDAAQEAFVTAYSKLADLRDLDSFPGWFRRLVMTACNRIARRPKLATTTLDEAAAERVPDGDPVRYAEQAELRAAVLAAVQSLSPPNRMATTLFYIDGYSVNEVAAFLEEPPGTVKYRLHESRRQLRERMSAMVKDAFAEEKPAEGFAERVLEEVGIGFPPGIITETVGETVTFLLSTPAAATSPGAAGLIGITFDKAAAAAIVPAGWRSTASTEAARPRCELLDLLCEVLRKSGTTLERVVLKVGKRGQASAVGVVRAANGSHDVALPASAALALAHRTKAKVFATPRLMRRGAAGEGVPPELDRKKLGELKAEVLRYRVRDELLDLAWQNGLDPDAGCRTVRWAVNEAEGTIGLFVGRRRRPVAVVDLAKYRDGVAMLRRDAALKRQCGGQFRNGKSYRLRFREAGSEIRCEVTRVRGE